MVLRVLTNCVPHLQDLEVPDFSMQEGSIQNTRTLDALALQRLRFEQAPRAVDVPVAIMAVNACKALTSFRAKFLHYADNLVMALDATHAGTLEEFTLYRSGFFSSHLIHHLLCRCPRLKEFSIANDMWDCGLRLRDVMDDKVWACKGLKTLRLIVCRSIRDIDDGQDEDMPMEDDFTVDNTAAEEAHLATADTMETDDMGGGSHCAKPHRSASDLCAEGVRRLYQRIGELSELEILELRYTCLDDRDPLEEEIERDMTLEGGLPFLSELKSLRQLLLISDLWSEMGQCEVEFIESNWPRLELVAFGLDAKEMDWEGPEFGHWRWLKKMRPEVRFIFLDDDNQEVYSQF
ncbi:hypothetical protein BGZ58_006267 [Dissophora ornata]|nr:hypothetical protein BGZ58_006267 [Dissophora ornata]